MNLNSLCKFQLITFHEKKLKQNLILFFVSINTLISSASASIDPDNAPLIEIKQAYVGHCQLLSSNKRISLIGLSTLINCSLKYPLATGIYCQFIAVSMFV